MASSDKAETNSLRIGDVADDPNAAMRRAALLPVRVTAKIGKRVFHIATLRRGDRKDPVWPAALPVTAAALKRHGARILRLASALQIALRVQATRTSANIFFIEPGRDGLDFAAHRLGGSIGAASLLETALRRSPVALTASKIAAKHGDARRQAEAKSLQDRIATLERALKKSAGLAAELEKSEAALRQARADQKAAEAAAQQSALDQEEEARALMHRVATLDRALKKATAQGPALAPLPAESAAPGPVLL
jgi:hypothetical protein